ncbi:glycosyltransferase [Flavobacteriaceae bacterium GSB9]|nr:glycosyltransferase [Flavobacteriaceae bacterium GSB9]
MNETLSHLAKQVVNKGFVYEVVLVDNNSTDNTAEYATNIWDELNTYVAFKVVRESTPGLSYARKKGVLASCGDIIIFCDDDNWLQSNYIQTAYDFMILNPSVGALGGQSEGVLEGKEPIWWQKEKLSYAVGKQAEHSGNVSKRGYVWGAGMVSRRDILFKLYQSDFKTLLTGRKGKGLASGDDSEICKWVLLMGFKLWYLEGLFFTHYITKNRLKDDYLQKLLKGHQQSQEILNLYNWILKTDLHKKIVNLTIRKRLFYLKSALKKCIKKNVHWKKYMQVTFMGYVYIDSNLYSIFKTYKKVHN